MTKPHIRPCGASPIAMPASKAKATTQNRNMPAKLSATLSRIVKRQIRSRRGPPIEGEDVSAFMTGARAWQDQNEQRPYPFRAHRPANLIWHLCGDMACDFARVPCSLLTSRGTGR